MKNTAAEIKREIRETKREMKETGVRVISCFNGGLDPVTYRYNARLFQLKVELEHASKDNRITDEHSPMLGSPAF